MWHQDRLTPDSADPRSSNGWLNKTPSSSVGHLHRRCQWGPRGPQTIQGLLSQSSRLTWFEWGRPQRLEHLVLLGTWWHGFTGGLNADTSSQAPAIPDRSAACWHASWAVFMFVVLRIPVFTFVVAVCCTDVHSVKSVRNVCRWQLKWWVFTTGADAHK